MNSYERVMNRLQARPVDRPPNFDIMMQFAARYIKQPLSRYYLDFRVLCEANFAVQQDFYLDVVQAISDPYRETADFGAKIEFPEDGLPMSLEPLIKEPEEIKKLISPDPCVSQRMSDRLEAIRTMREQVGGQVPIMGWVEGALAEAADLRHLTDLMIDLVRRPEWLKELLEITVEVGIAFAREQVQAGADIIGLGDAVASLISPSMYREFALPYEQRIFEAVHDAGGLARLHICGNTNKILADMVDSGADIIDIDWMVDIEKAAAAFGDEAALCGNFDPVAVMLQETPDQVREATLTCGRLGGSRWISAAGCEIPDGTPAENLFAQAEALMEMGNQG
jgi:MtaA/CmuA family methyltransferase